MSALRFKSFVVFAEMRTGSNFLEQNINQFSDLHSYGELFNPHFIGGANKQELLGVTMVAREKDPFQVVAAIKAVDPDVVPGFRFFNDHDPRILQKCLDDPTCGKVILTRNPLDSYISRKIAAVTGQWKLTNLNHQKTAAVEFDAAEFLAHVEVNQAFQVKLLNALQTSGQTAFYINYDDIHSVEVLNGLAKFLGSAHRVEAVNTDLKKQNPASLESKVTNFSEMQQALGQMDFLGLSRTPTFEPRRGAGVPQFVLGNTVPLMFLPIKGGPVEAVKNWMAAHDGGPVDALLAGLNQKDLRKWRHDHTRFQAFSVLRHPVARAYFSFCTYILPPDNGGYRDMRETLIRSFGVRLPKKGAEAGGYDLETHRAAFLAFLKFLKSNLANQTSVRVDPAWASQTAVLQGASNVIIPAHVIDEADLGPSLAHLEGLLGLASKGFAEVSVDFKFELADIYDADIEARVRDVYARDYLNFGFTDWAP